MDHPQSIDDELDFGGYYHGKTLPLSSFYHRQLAIIL
jgi:hypothetical protein